MLIQKCVLFRFAAIYIRVKEHHILLARLISEPLHLKDKLTITNPLPLSQKSNASAIIHQNTIITPKT